jgi:hypothetical protein
VRSLVWTLSAAPVLEAAGVECPSGDQVIAELVPRLPGIDAAAEARLRRLASMDAQALSVEALQ